MMIDDHPTHETSNDPATTEPAEPKQRKLRAEHHAELLAGLANKQSSGDAAEHDDEPLWDRQKVLEYFGGNRPLNVATLYRGVKDGRFPLPINVSLNAVRWIPRECRAARQRMLSERPAPKTPPPPARRGRPRGRKPAAERRATTTV